jgi:hypothetical protein
MIITFYSFKGGVGRSMALANIAELFYRRGLKVLMVDFDLEAPGLERYFDVKAAQTSPANIQPVRGMIDMLVSYKEMRSFAPPVPPGSGSGVFPYSVEPVENFVASIYPPNEKGGSLSLLPAGSRCDETYADYARRVLEFNWKDFYLNCDGERYFEWFREQVERSWDVTLIDSRTGVTEMGGVCTHHLADAVVSFVATNRQNLDGVLMMTTSLTKPDLLERRKRPLHLLFVPAGVELSEEDKHDDFAEEFNARLGPLFPPQLHFHPNPFVELKIFYVPAYSYLERVAVREPERASKADLIAAFERLAGRMAQLGTPGTPFFDAYSSSLSPADWLSKTLADLYEHMDEGERTGVRELFSRLAVAEEDGSPSAQKAKLEELSAVPAAVMEKLTAAKVIESGATVGLTDPGILQSWPKPREWLVENREFLKWRAGLNTLRSSWTLSGRSAKYLLSGRPRAEARRFADQRPERINELERRFVRASVTAARKLVAGVVALVCLVWLAGATVSFFKNRALESQVDSLIKGVQDMPQTPTQNALLRLEALRVEVASLAESARYGAPWYSRWGFYAGNRLLPEAKQAYFDAFYRLLLGGVRSDLLAGLKVLSLVPETVDFYDTVYNNLRAYLMMTSNHDKTSVPFLSSQLFERWSSAHAMHPELTSLVRKQFEYYAEALTKENPYSTANDSTVVAQARSYLAKFPAADKAYYALLKAVEATPNSGGLQFDQKIPDASMVVADIQMVSGAFTKEGWATMMKAFEQAPSYLKDQSWVLGEQAVDPSAIDRAQLQDRYVKDYIKEWRSFLYEGKVLPYSSMANASAKLQLLARNPSPLMELFCFVSQNTDVDSPQIAKAFGSVHAVQPLPCTGQILGSRATRVSKRVTAAPAITRERC